MRKIRSLLIALNFIITTVFSFFGMYLMVNVYYAREVGNILFDSRILSSVRIIPFLCFLIVIVSNVLFLFTFKRKDRTKEAVRISNPAGVISISAQSIESLAKLEAQQMENISDIRTRIISTDNKATIEVMVKVPPVISIPEVSAALQSRIKNKIIETTGIEIASVRIIVDGILEPVRHQ
ncbi:MAG: alkaline shock response membrane anchor protein AmaP [Clostridia bacterium]